MFTEFVLKFFLIAVLSQLFSILMNIYSLKKKAKVANLEWRTGEFFGEEAPRLGAVFCVLIIAVILLPYAPASWNELTKLVIGSLLGYGGTDVALRLWGAANKRLNAAIDMKANIADASIGLAPGTLTPATKPVKEDPIA